MNKASRLSNKKKLPELFHGSNFLWAPVVILLITLVNLSLVASDMWDGVIFAYGYELGDLRGWEKNLDESGWESAAPAIFLSVTIGQILGSTYYLGYKVIASVALVLLSFETYKFMRGPIMLPTPWAALGTALVISSTVWTAAAGSAMIWHVLAPPLVLTAVRFVYKSQTPLGITFGVAVLVSAFTLNSTVLFAPAIALSYELASKNANKRSGLLRIVTWRLTLVISLGLAWLFLQALLNPKYGRYDTYNSVSNLISIGGAYEAVKAAVWFGLYLFPLIAICLIILHVSEVKAIQLRPLAKSLISSPAIFLAMTLLVSASMPYILVGKAPIFYEVWDWQGRHGMLFSIALGILSATILSHVSMHPVVKQPRLGMTLVLIWAVTSSLIQILGYQFKLERVEFNELLATEFTKSLPNIPKGYLYLEFSGGPSPSQWPYFDRYELQSIVFSATGNTDWLTLRDVDVWSEPKIPGYFSVEDLSASVLEKVPTKIDGSIDPLRDLFSGSSLSCVSHISIVGEGWGRPFSPLVRTLLNHEKPQISLHVRGTTCVD